MSIRVVNSPTKKAKRVISANRSIDYSPYVTYDFSPSTYNEIAPTTNLQRYNISKASVDYSPSLYHSLYSDYAPSNSYSTGIRIKYSPYTDYQTYDRYAPYTKEVVVYEPVLVSRFKPQPLIVSNYDMITSYFRYIVDLLSILR